MEQNQHPILEAHERAIQEAVAEERQRLAQRLMDLAGELRTGIAANGFDSSTTQARHAPAIKQQARASANGQVAKPAAATKRKRHRAPTVASEEQMQEVLEALQVTNGAPQTVRQVQMVLKKRGSKLGEKGQTVAAACAQLAKAEVAQKHGNTYMVAA